MAKSIAPFQVEIVSIGKEANVIEAADKLEKELTSLGFEVLLDDREERPGVKFKDADLWGIPVRIGVGKKGLEQGQVEWKLRSEKNFEMVDLDQITEKLRLFYN